MAINIKKIEKQILENIINDYQNGKSMRQIEQDYGVTRQSVAKYLEEQKIKTTKGNHYRIYNHDEDFFEIIDTEEKAYWLGFMFADGYIVNQQNRYGQDQFGISLAKTDLYILYKFKESIKATNPILIYPRKNNYGQPLCRIVMTSQKTVNDLIDKGCKKQKSHILEPPKNVPDILIRHFIRGFFDGDGSITKTYSKTYNKYIFGINITSTQKICEWLQYLFDFGSIVKEKRTEKTYYFSFGGNNQLEYFYHYLYDNATIWMDRKYNKFQEFLKISRK